jgi:hypothetical protein
VYRAGKELRFEIVFNEIVTVTGAPTLPLVIGGQVRLATLVAGSGTNRLTFSYRILTGDKSRTGITVGRSLRLANASIRDAAGNAGDGVLPAVNASGVRIP